MPRMTRFSLQILLSSFVLTLTSFAQAETTTAQNCSNIQISIEKLGPVRDQGIAGLCFTYEGADLLTYKLGTRISAIDLALSYFKSSRSQKMSSIYESGGDTFTSIQATKKLGGACTEDVMPSNETFLSPDETNPRIFGAFKWLEQKSWALPESLEAARVIFPALEEDTFDQAARLLTFKDRMHFLQNTACAERVAYSHLVLNYFEAETKSQVPGLIKKVNQQLERNNLIGMGFRSNDLFLKQEEADDNHATTLVGRRWNPAKKQCEYLMRDNFGDQCSIYQNRFECQGGYVWLDEKFLLKNMYEIEYF